MTIMQKMKAIAVPVTNIVVPLGISILSSSIAKEYIPKQDRKYKQVLQDTAVAAITAYVSAKVTANSVEQIEVQLDEFDDVANKINEMRGKTNGFK